MLSETIRTIASSVFLAALVMLAGPSAQAEEAAVADIKATLTRWMEDFNAGKADKVCGLFAADLRADFRGQPERNYEALCRLLKRSLRDGERTCAYALDIKEILVFDDTAIVRLVWTLTVKQRDGTESRSVEPGLDVFRKQPDGRWKIVRYMAYEQ